MLKIILLCIAMLLSGVSIGLCIAQLVFRTPLKWYEEELEKHMATLRWIHDIPQQCWCDGEFLKHVDKLIKDILKREDEPDEKTV